jgi:hypothetical protein
MEFSIGDNNADNAKQGGRVEIQLFADQASLAVENFRALSTGEKLLSVAESGSGKPSRQVRPMHPKRVVNKCLPYQRPH